MGNGVADGQASATGEEKPHCPAFIINHKGAAISWSTGYVTDYLVGKDGHTCRTVTHSYGGVEQEDYSLGNTGGPAAFLHR